MFERPTFIPLVLYCWTWYSSYINIYFWLKLLRAGCWWLTSVILTTQEAETRRITVQSQSGQIVHETLSQKKKKKNHKKRAGGVTQGVSPGFKLQHHTQRKDSQRKLDMVAHACNPATWEAEAGELFKTRSFSPAWAT
jgi:hypothetical protein